MPEREPPKSMEIIVAQEMKRPNSLTKMFIESGDDKEVAQLRAYLNNFSANMPGGDGLSIYQQNMTGLYGKFEGLSAKDLFGCCYYSDLPQEKIKEEMKRGWSKKRLEATEGEFAADIKRAIMKSGIDEQELIMLIDDDKRRMSDMAAWKNLLLPVYIEMRKMGYSENDLTS
ncbi:hypothetical protein KKC88_01390 [Patescibacteria group bacterium]|nr:hypothetical protein [Patescibacteria group bacterium]MBU1673352.1 hypothetical protein [Patescibacteria group bacterium]MBU1963988.1 hypothetical protein [Patescibacteria group bacterium]